MKEKTGWCQKNNAYDWPALLRAESEKVETILITFWLREGTSKKIFLEIYASKLSQQAKHYEREREREREMVNTRW